MMIALASLFVLTGSLSDSLAVREALSSDRTRAFERVYAEGRWINGADGARAARLDGLALAVARHSRR